ncbi:MAG: MFS transporter [Anaplasma ovis]
MSSGRAKSYVGWLTTVMMLISLSCSECMYSAFGGVVLHSELKVAALMFARMCFFALFQLFSGALIDHYGGKLMLPIAALCTCVGVLFQMLTCKYSFLFMVMLSQPILTFGASFCFIGAGYTSMRFFTPPTSGIMFGLAQMAHGLSYALFGILSFYHNSFLEEHFRFLVSCLIAVQFAIFLMALCTVENPQGHVSVRMKFAEVVGSMRDILATKDTLYASIIGGMMFGMFFATAGFLVYKLDSRVAYLVSMYAWVGFSLGAPFACWVLTMLQDKKRVLFVFCVLQMCSLPIVALLIQWLLSSEDLSLVVYLCYFASFCFGFAAGGHMIAFTLGHGMASERVTTFCAIVNGVMCTIAGSVILVLTFLSGYYSLTTLLIYSGIVAFVLSCVAHFRLSKMREVS